MKEKVVILAAIALALAGFSLRAKATNTTGRAVMVIVDRLTWPELADAKTPNLTRLSKLGAVGLLGNRTAKPNTTSGRSYLTMGAGARADAPYYAGQPINESIIKSLLYLNRRTGYRAKVGLLATKLRRKGIAVAVIGNADAVNRRGRHVSGREAVLIGIDDAGRVPPGDTSISMLRQSSLVAGSGGRKIKNLVTDYRKLAVAFIRFSKPSSFVIVETGDSRRIDVSGGGSRGYLDRLTKRKTIVDADRFVGEIADDLDLNRDLLIVVSPSPPVGLDSRPVEALTPIIMIGKGIKPGVLVSPSTRRPALVTSPDIAPTIADFFGVDLGQRSSGRKIGSLPRKVSLKSMAARADEYLLSERLSIPIIVGYGVVEFALLAFVVLGLNFFRGIIIRARQGVRLLILMALSMPMGIYLAPFLSFSFTSQAAYVTVIIAITLVIALVAWRLPEYVFSPLILVTGLTALFLTLNMLGGAPADGKSAFGYSTITAARFYGISNHYLSILVPAVLIATLLWLEKSGRDFTSVRRPLAVLFVFVVFVVGYGGLGANTGGIIMMAPAFTLAYFWLRGRRFKARHLAIAVVNTAIALVGLAAMDAVFPSEPAHLGIVTRQVYSGALPNLVDILKRKAILNVSAFNYTYLSFVLIAAVVVLLIWQLFRRQQEREWAITRHPYAGVAFFSGGTAGVAGSLANDSGLAIMAMSLGYLLAAILYLEVCDLKAP